MSNSRVVPVGVAIGALLLAAVACFAIFLPRADGDSPAGELTDTLAGDWSALDRESSLQALSAQSADLQAQAANYASQAEYADQQLASAGLDSSSRFYGTAALDQLALVQVVSGEGSIFIPDNIVDPAMAASGGGAGTQLSAVPGGSCVVAVYDESLGAQSGSTYAQCQVSRDGVTVKVTGQATKDEAMELVEAVLG